jgi:6-phosphogluconolactonase
MMLSHRSLAWSCSLAVLLGYTAAAWTEESPAKVDKYWVFFGTYTDGESKGIYRCELDLSSGKLSDPALAAETVNPAFLAIHPSGRYLYSVEEVRKIGDEKSGSVSAFALDSKTGKLKFLNKKLSGGQSPCHLVVDRQGKHVLVANYFSGNAAVLSIGGDGRLGDRTGFVQHEGKGVDPVRQEAPHAHSINLDAANRFAFVADLGLDRVFVYRFDRVKGTLDKNDPLFTNIAPKCGPRHFAFHPSGKYAYVINELASTVTAMKYNSERGTLTKVQTVPTLPEGYKG